MNDKNATQIGLAIVKLFGLKSLPEYDKHPGGPRFATDFGSKTIEGVGRCISRIMDETLKSEVQ